MKEIASDDAKKRGEAGTVANGRTLHFKNALTPQGWRNDVRLTIADGSIVAIDIGVAPEAGDERHVFGAPGVGNLHSHAFQRAMAGLAERRGAGADSFWTWRETMYRFALAIGPDEMEAIAAQAYVEMLEAGFTRVGEFHYLHHAPDGRAYADIAEMASRIVAAATQTGLGLTLLPVFYAHAGFGGQAPSPDQRRFVCGLDQFARLREACVAATRGLAGSVVGIAPHSLRAATARELSALAILAPPGPIHIHVAEQIAEVDACLASSGARPVQWLLDHMQVDARWCLIHATHVDGRERERIAASGAVVGLCPITEANLGDGVFPAAEYFNDGGRWGVGSDSNVDIALAGELRMLEYGQRLTRRLRAVLADPGGPNGARLYDGALGGAGLALGRATTGFAVGADADIVTFESDVALRAETLLDVFVFARDVRIDAVYARGRQVVTDGVHVARERVRDRFRAAMMKLDA
jgi:formiminoglutamate deiminase